MIPSKNLLSVISPLLSISKDLNASRKVKNLFYILLSISSTQGLTSSGNINSLIGSNSGYPSLDNEFCVNFSFLFYLIGVDLVAIGGSSNPAFCNISFISLSLVILFTRYESWHMSMNCLRSKRLIFFVVLLTIDWYINAVKSSGN
jgi:hypothetical protein